MFVLGNVFRAWLPSPPKHTQFTALVVQLLADVGEYECLCIERNVVPRDPSVEFVIPQFQVPSTNTITTSDVHDFLINVVGFPIAWSYEAYFYAVAFAQHYSVAPEPLPPSPFTHQFWESVLQTSKESIINGEPFDPAFDNNGNQIKRFFIARPDEDAPIPVSLRVFKEKKLSKCTMSIPSTSSSNSTVESSNSGDILPNTNSGIVVNIPTSSNVTLGSVSAIPCTDTLNSNLNALLTDANGPSSGSSESCVSCCCATYSI